MVYCPCTANNPDLWAIMLAEGEPLPPEYHGSTVVGLNEQGQSTCPECGARFERKNQSDGTILIAARSDWSGERHTWMAAA